MDNNSQYHAREHLGEKHNEHQAYTTMDYLSEERAEPWVAQDSFEANLEAIQHKAWESDQTYSDNHLADCCEYVAAEIAAEHSELLEQQELSWKLG